MKILIVCKRQYTSKDLLDDRYGRLYEIPKYLSKQHQLQGVCLSYRVKREGAYYDPDLGQRMFKWQSLNLGYLVIPGLYAYLKRLCEITKDFKPDVIYACSDCYQIILGAWLAKKFNIPFFVDLYDNFESFSASRLPGVMYLYKRALASAKGISCVSPALVEYIQKEYKLTVEMLVLENAIPPKQFHPLDKAVCRKYFNLPQTVRIIGTVGALNKNRGIEILYESFIELAQQDKTLHMVLAGPYSPGCVPPQHERIHYLGCLPSEEVIKAINCLDVAVICNLDSAFGRYCFPQKAYEFMACKIPLVAAAVGSMDELLQVYPECLFQVESSDSMNKAIEGQLENPTKLELPIPDWQTQAEKLESFFLRLCC